MIYKYEELLKMKENSEKLDFNSITKEQLSSLFINENVPNSLIAELYDISPNTVRYKRNKWNITMNSSNYIYQKFTQENSDLFKNLNEDAKKRLLNKDNIDMIAKALTVYCFRNSPIENMHSNNQLSQNDMKTLNKFMVDKLASILSLVLKGEWLKIELMLNYQALYGNEWDKANIDTTDFDEYFNNILKGFGTKSV